ncbi:hypothetical protein EI555_020898 [Monodon monoceros]|uniref:Tubulin--tyrosine ligase-like protein 9 n=1 Tax=Monodon monoceros TaxID=40151 RepID=A0A4U1F807_MONMO|nr:hypothetical protein EI555_020898 [Monodon monoceros]
MEPSTCKTSESEENYGEEEESEECVKGEATIPSNPSQQALSKLTNAFRNRVPLSIVAKKIPKKIITPADPDELEVGRRKRRWKHRPLAINLTNCKYESVRRAAQMCGLKEVGEDKEWTVYWTDCSVSLERIMDMKRFQKVNHFPGMTEICHKDLLARNLSRMQKLYPTECNIFPCIWCLPAEGMEPFLIDGFKFDMRMYVLITPCDPLQTSMYEEGLASFTTMPYDDPCMHLTNYAVNRHNENFVRDDAVGIGGTCACFEILGFDILLDHKRKPWLLEVNYSPSFTTDSHLD